MATRTNLQAWVKLASAADTAWTAYTVDANGKIDLTGLTTGETYDVSVPPDYLTRQIVADSAPSVSLTAISVSAGTAATVNPTYGGTNRVYSLSGPDWLSINAVTGQITGTAPSDEVSTTYTVTVSNAASSVSATASVTVTVPVDATDEAPVLAISAEGWITWDTSVTPIPATFEPDSDPIFVTAESDGFDATGAAVKVTRRIPVTTRLRGAGVGDDQTPELVARTADTAALADALYATDVVAGATNSSAFESPKPTVRWVTTDKSIVANSVSGEITAAHRDAKDTPLSCVVVTATDGTTTVSTTVTEMTVSSVASDKHAVLVYAWTLDITSLNNGLVTVNAKAYPRLGVAASVVDSADSAVRSEFSPRFYRKDPGLVAAPLVAVVETVADNPAATGTTGYVGTDIEAARAAPWTTVHGIIRYGLDANNISAEINIYLRSNMLGTGVLTSVAGRRQEIAALNIDKDPEIAGPLIIETGGQTRLINNSQTPGQMIKVRNLTVRRNALYVGESFSQLEMVFENCTMDFNSAVHPFGANSGGQLHGCAVSGLTNAPDAGLATGSWHLLRGNSVPVGAGCPVSSICTIGNDFTDIGRALPTQSFVAFNILNDMRTDSASSFFRSTTNGATLMQNVIELTSAMDGLRVSGDSDFNNANNIIWQNNTIVGNAVNRANSFYDDTVGTPRNHVLMSIKGNIFGHIRATKGDLFRVDATAVGNWQYSFGVGSAGNLTCFETAFPRDYIGLSSLEADVAYVDDITDPDQYINPLFVAAKQRTPAGDGIGGGDYHVTAGSPAIGLAPRILPFDLDGVARPETATAGAFEYVA